MKSYRTNSPMTGWDVRDLQGYCSSYNLGLSNYDISFGGDLDEDGTNPFAIGYSYWKGGGGVSIGSPVGLTWQQGYTFTFGTTSGR